MEREITLTSGGGLGNPVRLRRPSAVPQRREHRNPGLVFSGMLTRDAISNLAAAHRGGGARRRRGERALPQTASSHTPSDARPNSRQGSAAAALARRFHSLQWNRYRLKTPALRSGNRSAGRRRFKRRPRASSLRSGALVRLAAQLHFGTNGVINRFKSPLPPDANLSDRGAFSFSADAVCPFQRLQSKRAGVLQRREAGRGEERREEESEMDPGSSGATAAKRYDANGCKFFGRDQERRELMTANKRGSTGDGQLATHHKMAPDASAPR